MKKIMFAVLAAAFLVQASPVLAGGDCNALCSVPHHSYDDCMRECISRRDAYRDQGYWPPQVQQVPQYVPVPPGYGYAPPQPIQQCWRDQYGRTFCQ